MDLLQLIIFPTILKPFFALLPSGVQEMLRKFEFFPIKCRIQRAAEVFAEIREELLAPVAVNHKEVLPIKAKVLYILCHYHNDA